MSNVEGEAQAEPDAQEAIVQQPGGLHRAGRALIGWMTPEEGAIALAARNREGAQQQDLIDQVEAARQTVAGRQPGVDQAGVIEELPEQLNDYAAQLQANEAATNYFNEGWTLAVADLSRVCSLQPVVLSEEAEERAAAVDGDDINAIATLTLPQPQATDLPAQFDEARMVWMIPSANPNLKLTGHFGGQLQPGVVGFGFTVGVLPSFVQVVRHHDRYVLRDGYHRAYGLLARGVTRAPVLFRDFGVAPLGLTHGLFGTDVYLGERPPLLIDFLDDAVAADVRVPASHKIVVVQGLELTPLG